jgi:hypothetical protein
MTPLRRQCKATLRHAESMVDHMRETRVAMLLENIEYHAESHHAETRGPGRAMESLPLNWSLISLFMNMLYCLDMRYTHAAIHSLVEWGGGVINV